MKKILINNKNKGAKQIELIILEDANTLEIDLITSVYSPIRRRQPSINLILNFYIKTALDLTLTTKIYCIFLILIKLPIKTKLVRNDVYVFRNRSNPFDLRKGAGHGWKDMPKDAELFADWWEEHLGKPEVK